MNLKSTQIEISKEYLNFSVGHFTIFSKSHRENLHGHNYRLAATIDAPVEREGLTFDYNLIKKTIKALCDEIDERFCFLPTRLIWILKKTTATYMPYLTQSAYHFLNATLRYYP